MSDNDDIENNEELEEQEVEDDGEDEAAAAPLVFKLYTSQYLNVTLSP